MRRLFAAAAATILVAGFASAQYKTPPQPKTGGAVQVPAAANSGAVQITPAVPSDLDSAKRITRDDAMKMVTEGKAVYIDVRAKDQYDLGHIKGAISIPGTELQTRLKDLPVGKYLITYCA